jgi:hypothetical protein
VGTQFWIAFIHNYQLYIENMNRLIATSKTNSAKIDSSALGPPGIVTCLNVVPVMKDGLENAQRFALDLGNQKFRVEARFSVNGNVGTNINFNFSQDSGDSFFQVAPDIRQLEVETTNGPFTIFLNENKRLSSVKFPCVAQSSFDARVKFENAVMPAIDHLSYLGNAPLHIVQISVSNEQTQEVSTEFLSPYPAITLGVGLAKVRPLMVPVYAMYRESKNSVSPFYRFFSLYKILEGLLKPIQSSLRKEAKEREVELPSLDKKVPEYADATAEQKKYVGKSIKRFFDDYLTPEFRNSIAHFVNDDQSVLNVSQVVFQNRYSEVIHVMEICCRELVTYCESCIDLLEPSQINNWATVIAQSDENN